MTFIRTTQQILAYKPETCQEILVRMVAACSPELLTEVNKYVFPFTPSASVESPVEPPAEEVESIVEPRVEEVKTPVEPPTEETNPPVIPPPPPCLPPSLAPKLDGPWTPEEIRNEITVSGWSKNGKFTHNFARAPPGLKLYAYKDRRKLMYLCREYRVPGYKGQSREWLIRALTPLVKSEDFPIVHKVSVEDLYKPRYLIPPSRKEQVAKAAKERARDKLNMLLYSELSKRCRQQRLPYHGKKDQLIQRLLNQGMPKYIYDVVVEDISRFGRLRIKH